MSTSGGLKPRAVAGRPSVTRLTQSSWTGMRASGRPRAAVKKMLCTRTSMRDAEGGRHNYYCALSLINMFLVLMENHCQFGMPIATDFDSTIFVL